MVEQITVTLADRTEYEAEVVGRDQVADIAVLKINPTRPLPFVRFGDSTRTRVGDWVIAIGNPFGLGGTVTAGIVSALHRNIGAGLYDRYIQTDASINSGNSGGPMFDVNGNVIGINTALISPTGGNVGIGFAIPAEQIAPVVDQLRRGERVHRGYIGVGMQDVDESVAAALGIERNRGTLIRSVTPGGPAARAGMQQGDVVVSVAGHPVTPDATLAYLISQQAIGAHVPIEVIRQGQHHMLNIAIAERPTEEELARLNGIEDDNAAEGGETGGKPSAPTQSAGQRSAQASLGLALEPLTPGVAAAAQHPRRKPARPRRRRRRPEQRRRPEGHPGGRRHPLDQPAADAHRRGGRRDRGRGAARRAQHGAAAGAAGQQPAYLCRRGPDPGGRGPGAAARNTGAGALRACRAPKLTRLPGKDRRVS